MSKIAYIGTGPLVAVLMRRLQSTHEVVAFPSAAGASVAESRVVVLNMRSDGDVEDALFGTGGLANRFARGTIVIDQSPGDPDETRRRAGVLRERGVSLVDAPIHCERFDTYPEAAALVCGGASAAIDAVRSVLESLCPKVVHCGDSGNGRACHLVVCAVAACNRLVTLECATIGIKNGLSLGDMATVLDASSGYNSAIARVLPALDSGGRTADVELGASVTDLKLAAELGKRCSAPMLVANLVCSNFEGAANVLGNDATIDAMSRMYEAAAGVTFRQPAK
jgi:3-hydroxyisobutyrate dehydrogenase